MTGEYIFVTSLREGSAPSTSELPGVHRSSAYYLCLCERILENIENQRGALLLTISLCLTLYSCANPRDSHHFKPPAWLTPRRSAHQPASPSYHCEFGGAEFVASNLPNRTLRIFILFLWFFHYISLILYLNSVSVVYFSLIYPVQWSQHLNNYM